MKYFYLLFICTTTTLLSQTDQKIYNIIDAVSENRIKADVKTLTEFGTRNTFSDTLSATRGIGAARRWIKSTFEDISKDCNNCINVFYQKDLVTTQMSKRVPHDAWVVNVVAIQQHR